MSVTKRLAKKLTRKVEEINELEKSYIHDVGDLLKVIKECKSLLEEAVAENKPPQKQASEDIRGEGYQTEGEWEASKFWS